MTESNGKLSLLFLIILFLQIERLISSPTKVQIIKNDEKLSPSSTPSSALDDDVDFEPDSPTEDNKSKQTKPSSTWKRPPMIRAGVSSSWSF